MRRRLVLPLAALAAVVLTVALVLFEPWTLFTDETVSEAVPVAGPVPTASPTATVTPTATASATEPPIESPIESRTESRTESPTAPAEPEVLATGSFISHEHETTGRVRVLRLADGSRVLRIEGLDTSNGPDLRVWLSDAEVLPGRGGWFVFDDGAYLDLGALRGNRGDQNYPVPDDVDLDVLTSVSVWCARFRVSFGAATLASA